MPGVEYKTFLFTLLDQDLFQKENQLKMMVQLKSIWLFQKESSWNKNNLFSVLNFAITNRIDALINRRDCSFKRDLKIWKISRPIVIWMSNEDQSKEGGHKKSNLIKYRKILNVGKNTKLGAFA